MKLPANIQFEIDSNAPYFTGHFKQNPIVPGARLLDLMTSKMRQHGLLPSASFELAQIKFTAAVKPGAAVDCQFDNAAKANQLTFVLSVDGHRAAHGLIKFDQP